MYALVENPQKHFYPTRNKPVRLIVLHVTAGLQDLDMLGIDHSAEKTNQYGASTTRAASWHKCVDSDSIADALPDEYTAFHCKDYNGCSLGLEISNQDAVWDNKPKEWTEATLLNAARVCLDWERKFDIPRVLLSKADVDAGQAGYSYHMFLDPTRRHDPGATFPWNRFVQILDSLDKVSTMSEEDEFMLTTVAPGKSSVIPVPKPPTGKKVYVRFAVDEAEGGCNIRVAAGYGRDSWAALPELGKVDGFTGWVFNGAVYEAPLAANVGVLSVGHKGSRNPLGVLLQIR